MDREKYRGSKNLVLDANPARLAMRGSTLNPCKAPRKDIWMSTVLDAALRSSRLNVHDARLIKHLKAHTPTNELQNDGQDTDPVG